MPLFLEEQVLYALRQLARGAITSAMRVDRSAEAKQMFASVGANRTNGKMCCHLDHRREIQLIVNVGGHHLL
jgi:hypothetical protein